MEPEEATEAVNETESTDDSSTPPGHGHTCFVIGPIGNRHAPSGSDERTAYEEAVAVYEEVIVSACQAPSVGLEPVRADGLSQAGELTEQIFRRLRDDDVVIADVSGANANVMYELGLRHTRSKLTVQLGEYGRLPFDVNVIRTVMFSRSPNGLINARKELQQILEAGLAGEWDPVSATRVWNDLSDEEEPPPGGEVPAPASEPTPPASGAMGATTDEEDDVLDYPGLIDKLAEAEGAQDLLLSSATAITTQLELMGAIAEEEAEKMQAADARGLGMRFRLAQIGSFANRLDQVADNLEYHVGDYDKALRSVSTGWDAIIDHVESDASEQLDDAQFRELAEIIRLTASTSRESLAGLSALVASMNETARYAKALRRPTNRIAAALNDFTQASEILNELDRRLQIMGIDLPSASEAEPPADHPTEKTPNEP